MNGSSKLIFIPFLVTILGGIFVYFLTNLGTYLIVIIASVLLTVTLFFFFHEKIIALFQRLSIIGIKKIEPRKTDIIPTKPEFLLEANNHIWILGASLKTFWIGNNCFRDYLAQAGRRNVAITVLLLNPESTYLPEKVVNDEKVTIESYKDLIKKSIDKFKEFKQNNGIKTMGLYLYNDYPVWHMIMTDRNFAKISYYPFGRDGGEVPYYVFNNQGKYNLLEPFIIYFERLQERSEEVEL